MEFYDTVMEKSWKFVSNILGQPWLWEDNSSKQGLFRSVRRAKKWLDLELTCANSRWSKWALRPLFFSPRVRPEQTFKTVQSYICVSHWRNYVPRAIQTETVYATRSFLLIIMFVWRGCQRIKNRAERTGWHKQSHVFPSLVPGFNTHGNLKWYLSETFMPFTVKGKPLKKVCLS